MVEKFSYNDFDVEKLSQKINGIMAMWSINKIKIIGNRWTIHNHEDEVVYVFSFTFDFDDIELRIKLEDLRLNVIHFIESLKDDTTYNDMLIYDAPYLVR